MKEVVPDAGVNLVSLRYFKTVARMGTLAVPVRCFVQSMRGEMLVVSRMARFGVETRWNATASGQGLGIMTPDTPRHELPFVAECRTLPWRAPLAWLAAGARDLRRAPRLTLVYGFAIFVMSWGVSLLAWALGRFALLATFLSGFIYIAPVLAIGLHAVARDLERGREPSLRRSLRQQWRVLGQGAVYALMLLVIVFTWSRSGMMLYAIFEVERGDPRVLAEFLAVGSVIGTGFAALVFASAAFSLPMVVDRDADMVTAVLSSVHAVLRNKLATLVWAACIVAITALGFATGYVGFVLLMPWLAYSAWHGYRDTLCTERWPELPEVE